MEAEQTGTGRRVQRWRRGLWASLVIVVMAVLSLVPYLRDSTELVRMRNALLLLDQHPVTFDWSPPNFPADFRLAQGPSDPFFTDVANRLRLTEMRGDWDRALAISRHLLGTRSSLKGGAIMSDLHGTYQRIVDHGDGYCGDFVDVFLALALASDLPVRAWAFSFDGFGGHGHIWPEIWNRQLGKWQLVDIFNNSFFPGPDGIPMSAMEFRGALQAGTIQLRRMRLQPEMGYGMGLELKAWDYYRRGLPEWYMWWGNDVFAYDKATLVQAFSGLSRSLEQLGGVWQGVHPTIRVLKEPGNKSQRERMQGLRVHLLIAAWVALVAAAMAVLCGSALWYTRHTMARSMAQTMMSR